MGIPVLKEKQKQKNIVCLICILTISLAGTSIKEQVLSMCSPYFSFVLKDNEAAYENSFEKVLLSGVPFFSYVHENNPGNLSVQDENIWQRVREENAAKAFSVENSFNDYNSINEEKPYSASSDLNGAGMTQSDEAVPIDEAFMLENENAIEAPVNDDAYEFVPHERQRIFDMNDYTDFSTLFKTFYTMDSNTMVGRDELNVDTLLEPDVTIDKEAPGPQILIYHTHSQEAFADSVSCDKSMTVVGAGDKLAGLLTDKYGYSVLHHTGEYDVGDRDSAYSRSLPALEQILEENPSIQLIIDLHRDGVADDRKLAVDLDGRPTAQFMFFNGLSRTKNTGDIDYLYNPHQADNLALSFQMQLTVDEYYPGLARRIYLNGYRYNMHLRPSLLIELGAQTNTVEEIMNAVDPLAHVLDLVLSGKNPR